MKCVFGCLPSCIRKGKKIPLSPNPDRIALVADRGGPRGSDRTKEPKSRPFVGCLFMVHKDHLNGKKFWCAAVRPSIGTDIWKARATICLSCIRSSSCSLVSVQDEEKATFYPIISAKYMPRSPQVPDAWKTKKKP
ncbi:hypothetical protein ABW19_dt0208212 [Dactylella cylindrospora]|nr:hypothetical protein ABW19_dt0208212 [Dactylella cylindrospora]